MIHEILFRLWKKKPEESFNLDQLYEFLHPGEWGLLQEIVSIADRFYKIEAFVNGSEKSTNSSSGLYVTAFRDGISIILKEYRNEIRILETRFLENSQLSLSYVLSSLVKFVTVFDTIDSMISFVKTEQLHGCSLMGRLHKYLDGGVAVVTKAVNTIINSVNAVFYTQLSDWIIYGDFVDNHDEFFICKGNGPNPEFLYSEQLSESRNSSDLMGKKSKIKRPPVVWNFYINADMIPEIMLSSTAETILFMGTIVWVIKNEPKQTATGKYNLALQNERDVWEGKSCDYYSKISLLKSEPFNFYVFNKTIEECRIKLNKYLWNLFVQEADLVGHMQIIRDYYALGRGELFQHFIIASEEHVKDTPNHYVMQNLNFIFTDTAYKMYGDNYKTYQKFELSLPNNVQRDKPWSLLEMNFDILWPLHIVFHPKAMHLYNKLFIFLLRLKKTHIDLHKLWLAQMEGKQKINSQVWLLRHSLMFLVNNLQYYLQVDVIEAQFSLFRESIRNANDFKDIIALHNRFMTNLLSKTFVMSIDMSDSTDGKKQVLYQTPTLNYESNNVVYSCILNLLDLCEKFCFSANAWNSVLTERELDDLHVFQEQSNKTIDRLIFVLNSLRKETLDGHLLQLLLKLDYNCWINKQKPDLSLIS